MFEGVSICRCTCSSSWSGEVWFSLPAVSPSLRPRVKISILMNTVLMNVYGDLVNAALLNVVVNLLCEMNFAVLTMTRLHRTT